MDSVGGTAMQSGAYGGYANQGADLNSLTALLEPSSGVQHGDPNLGHDGYHQTNMGSGMQDVGVSYGGMDGVQGGGDRVGKGNMSTPRTLPAVLAHHMRSQGKPVSETELCNEVKKVYTDLRKPDGTRYTGNLERAVRGSLCSTGMFEKLENNMWTLREEQTQVYEQRLAAKQAKIEAEKSIKRRRKAESVKADEEVEGGERRKRKYVRKNPSTRLKRSEKRDAILDMLGTFSENLHKDQNWSQCYANPFKSFKGDEQADDVWKKLGNDKFIFMLQMFHYLSDLIQHRHLIQEQLAKEKQKNKENAKGAANEKNAKSEQTVPEQLNGLTGVLGNLDDMLQKLTNRLGNVENMVSGQPVWNTARAEE
mmetsp:Transcript_8047/g.24238  ORF Transcript_8047/g.24238 Transcript_8047/m.24238 type:complete len:366 (+) Transcript_8047:98-1195(+)